MSKKYKVDAYCQNCEKEVVATIKVDKGSLIYICDECKTIITEG